MVFSETTSEARDTRIWEHFNKGMTFFISFWYSVQFYCYIYLYTHLQLKQNKLQKKKSIKSQHPRHYIIWMNEINNTHRTHTGTHTQTHTHTWFVGKTNVLWVGGGRKTATTITTTTQETQICTRAKYVKVPTHALRHLCADTHLT